MKKNQVPDEELIRQVVLGDTVSYKTIVERYQRQIYGIGMRFFKNGEDSSDFVQEVFIRAYKSLGTYKGRAPFRFWLTRIAYNLGINQVQAAKARIECDIESQSVPGRESLPEESHLSDEIRSLLRQEVDSLPERYKISLDLYFYAGLTYRQIHEITGVPVNTIKSDVLRAKQILRDALKGTIAEEYNEV